MSRVINTDGPGKRRNFHMRTCAELIRRLSQKGDIDLEARNMLAHLVLSLREIDAGIDESAKAWEKRDYWIKSEEFRERWRWAGQYADELTAMIFAEKWDDLPKMMMKLVPQFSDVKVNKLTRSEKLWAKSYETLLEEKAK